MTRTTGQVASNLAAMSKQRICRLLHRKSACAGGVLALAIAGADDLCHYYKLTLF
jgi:hypothetical protein